MKANDSSIPVSIQGLLSYFQLAAILLGATTLLLVCIWLLTLFDDTAGIAPDLFRAIIIELALLGAITLEYWGIRHQVKWAWYVCWVVFFPITLNWLFFRVKNTDRVSQQLWHPDTATWFSKSGNAS